ncbi:MAG: cation:proton antiporter [Methanobacteriota archaeon]
MLLEITIAIIVAKILNVLFERIRQPGVIGEIIAGVILGPCCLGLLSGIPLNFFNITTYQFQLHITSPEFKEIAFIGVIFLLFIIGLETNLDDLKKARKAGIYTGIFGVIVPFIFGCLLGIVFQMSLLQSMAIGAIFLATSATIALRIFADMDMLSTRIGLTLHTAIVLNDILAILVFSIVFGTNNSLLLLIQILCFFVLTIGVGILLVKYATKKSTIKKAPMIVLTTGLAMCFLFSVLAENMGLTAIIGAFIAGIFVRKMPQAGVVVDHIKTIGYAFFIPLFFVWVGASFDFLYLIQSEQLGMLLFFIIAFVSFALLGNFIGGTIGAKLSGLNKKDSMSVGIGMMPIMGVALIIVTTGIDKGMFGDAQGLLANQIRIATLLLIIISCLITPTLLKRSMNSPLQKTLGKTKLKSYHLPHCPTCKVPLQMTQGKQGWYCEFCNIYYPLNAKKLFLISQKKYIVKHDEYIKYLIGGVTFVLCVFEIINLAHATIQEKIIAIAWIFIGTTLGYLIVKYYMRGIKRVVRTLYPREM